ncbi:MAG TPA: AAA family ATPase [Candidatus Corynebacterium avicola]|uniref:AAA family ATPase n=1 Tax=Candidatus Corynebacterium avicola TaxID=2838527 RepID=A0A9D1RMA9_9CORY|nr:AAA family ATPase [Candidatus Corynebacterium avicola]
MTSRLLLIGGRSGVGKSTVAFALHNLLAERDVRHAVIEGDALDLAHPEPWEHGLAGKNLAAMWANYRELGYRNLILTNTVSILEAEKLAAAMGDDPQVTAVLLEASDETTGDRMSRREQGDSLSDHIERSTRMAAFLDKKTSAEVHRVPTDGRTPEDLATAIADLAGWRQED